MIPIYKPYKLIEAKQILNNIIDSEWITWSGEYVSKCEHKLEQILNIKHVLLTNNGTSATHCIIKSIKYKYPECKKIYIPNNCYIAIYNMVLLEFQNSEIEILPIDIDTWNIDLNYLNNLEQNSALVLLHNIGNIIPINKIISKRPDLILVEDNCEGFMGKYDDMFSGTKSLCSSLSFFGNKNITCGEGGAFCTNNTILYNYIKNFTRQGQSDTKFIHNMIAFNYRITNLQAGILYSQINLLNEILDKKKNIFNLYYKYLKHDKIKFQHINENTNHSYWLFGIRIINNKSYDSINNYLYYKKIDTRPFFYNIKKHEHLKNIKYIDNYTHNNLEDEIIILPSYPELTAENIIYISMSIIDFINL